MKNSPPMLILLGLIMTAHPVVAQPAIQLDTSSHHTFNVHGYRHASDVADEPSITRALHDADVWTKSAVGRTATVFLPKGTYDLTHIYGLYAINIVGMHDISVDGESCGPAVTGCVKLIGASAGINPQKSQPIFNSFVRIVGSSNIAVRNLYLDKKVPYFVQGQVLAVNPSAHTVDVSADSRFMSIEDPLVQRMMNIVYFFAGADTGIWDHDESACKASGEKDPRSHTCTNFHITGRQSIGPGKWRLTLDKPPSIDFANKQFLIWKNLGWQWGIYMENVDNATIDNIFYTGGGGPAVHVRSTTGNVVVRNLTVDVPAGSGRLLSATSGVNGGKNRGSVTLSNVTIKHVDDDAFHLSAGSYLPLLAEDAASHEVRVGGCYEGDFRPGDHVDLLDWASKQKMASAVVVGSHVDTQHADARYPRVCDVQFDHALPAVSHMATYNPAMLGQTTDINPRLVNLAQESTAIVENSFFSSMRAHCGIIQVSGRFTNNTCADTPMEGLLVGPQYQWGEGYPVHGLTINGNTFRNIGGSAIAVVDEADSVNSPSASDISSGAKDAPLSDNTGIVIENNRFLDLGRFSGGYFGIRGGAITVQNADGIVIRNNVFDSSVATQVLSSNVTVKKIVR